MAVHDVMYVDNWPRTCSCTLCTAQLIARYCKFRQSSTMAEPEMSVPVAVNLIENPDVSSQEVADCLEPPLKRAKSEVVVETEEQQDEEDLEQRLNDILCCSVCLDLPVNLVYQVRGKNPGDFLA